MTLEEILGNAMVYNDATHHDDDEGWDEGRPYNAAKEWFIFLLITTSTSIYYSYSNCFYCHIIS